MMTQVSVLKISKDLEGFFDQLDDFVYALAASQNAPALEQMFTSMPFMLHHKAQRRIPGKHTDWQWISVPWAIFASAVTHDEKGRECMRMLKRLDFQPDANFYDRLIRLGTIPLIEDFFSVFAPDTAKPPADNDGRLNVIDYTLLTRLNDGDEEALTILKIAVRHNSNLNAENGGGMTPLFMLATNRARFERPDLAIQAVQLLLSAGASTDVTGNLQDQNGEERLPLSHAIERLSVAKCGCEPLLSFVSAHCAAGA